MKRIILILLLALLVTTPVLAQRPAGRGRGMDSTPKTPPPLSEPSAAPEAPAPPAAPSAPEPAWVPDTSHPGAYAARDYRDVDPDTYHVVGSQMLYRWDDLEPTEGNYQWHLIDDFLQRQREQGKRAVIGVVTFKSRMAVGESAICVPPYVFHAGATKIYGDDGFEIPKFWDPVYLQKYGNLLSALAARYDGHPDLEFILIGVGRFGETVPSDNEDKDDVAAALNATPDYASWAEVVNETVDLYADRFDSTPLMLPYIPRLGDECERRVWTDHAISRGVGLFASGLYAMQEWIDLRPKGGWSGCGKYDRILDHAETDATVPWVPVAFEAYDYMTPTPELFFWGVVAAMHRRVDYLFLDRTAMYRGAADDPNAQPIAGNVEVWAWANDYIGQTVDETPSVWVYLRESGYADHFYPQRGNYSWWLYQDDAVPGGHTVVVSSRAKRDLVSDDIYGTYGDAAVRPGIQAGLSFLGTGREGWIARRTDQASGNPYMGLKVDDAYRYGGSNTITVTVTYLDHGTDRWRLVYDGVNGERVAGTITKSGTDTWQDAVFTVNDARLANGLAGSADLRLECLGDGDEYIHRVDVSAGGVTDAPQGDAPGDLDGDGRTDLTVWRPSTGDWWTLTSASAYREYTRVSWGQAGDVPLTGDLDGDGRSDHVIWRPTTGDWWTLRSAGGYSRVAWGEPGDVPLCGDTDGDGLDDRIVWRPATGDWWLLRSSGGWSRHPWGQDGDRPLLADYDGDGRDDLIIWRPSTGRWWILTSASDYQGYSRIAWGEAGDEPLVGDRDGDGRDDLTVWRPATGDWWTLHSGGAYSRTPWGEVGDIPAHGDVDGDALADAMVWRPAAGDWWLLHSAGGWSRHPWGQQGDVPLP